MKFQALRRTKPITITGLFGKDYAFSADDQGRMVCDVEEEQAIARLLGIPEGFEPLDPVEKPEGDQTAKFTLEREGETIDLSSMTDEEVRAFALQYEVKVHHARKGDSLRAAVVEALAAEA